MSGEDRSGRQHDQRPNESARTTGHHMDMGRKQKNQNRSGRSKVIAGDSGR